jgi:hypothetical protein
MTTLPSSPLPNPRREAFAQAVALGQSNADAYLAVYGEGSRRAAGASGARLRGHPAVAARVQALQSAAAQDVTVHLHDLLHFLARVISTPISEVNATSDLCHRRKETAHGEEVLMPDKLAAVALAARLQGFFRAPPPAPSQPPVPTVYPPNVLTEEERLILIAQKRAAMEAMDGDDDPEDSDYGFANHFAPKNSIP